MTLPTITRPIHTTNILSRKEPVQFMPFSVAESKILMMAKESQDTKTVVDAVRQILQNCLVDKKIDVRKLPMVDLEWLFIQIHSKSMGERVPLFFKCTNKVGPGTSNDSTCGMLLQFDADLTKVDIANKDVNRTIKINEEVGMKMKFPTWEVTEKMLDAQEGTEDLTLAAMCIESVYDAQSVYNAAEATDEEMVDFVKSLPVEKYEAIQEFLDNCPMIFSEHQITCQKCGFHHVITLEGLEDHFT